MEQFTMTTIDKTKNQINVLHIFKENGVWMFNDSDVQIYKEPFVSSMNPIIDGFVGEANRFTAYISHSPMHEQTLKLNQVEDGMDGLYQLDNTDIIGWLCPALLKYFEYYPKNIYVKIQL